MKTKNKKKSIIKKVLAFSGAIFCSIVCAFSLFNINDTKSMEVSADTIESSGYSFSGSLLPFHYSVTDPDAYNNKFLTTEVLAMSGSYNFTADVNNVLQSIRCFSVIPYKSANMQSSNDLDQARLYSFELDFNVLNLDNFVGSYYDKKFLLYNFSHIINFPDQYQTYRIIVSTFNSDGNIVMGSPVYFDYYVDLQFGSICDCITYYDSDGNSLSFMHFFYKNTDIHSDYYYKNYICTSRRYYINAPNFNDNEYYQQGFDVGKSEGLSEGFSAGQNIGYSDGYKTGKNDGYWLGIEEGASDKYSFTSLIASVVDVPVRAFTSLFNFEILGVNLSGFLTGLFTFSVVIFILKLII